MKTLHKLFITAAAILAASCNLTNEETPTLAIDPAQLDFEYTGGSSTINVTASGEWSAYANSSEVSWISISPSSGSGDETVTITVGENGDKENARTGWVFFAYKGGTVSAKIIQAPSEGEAIFSIDPTSVSIGGSASEFSITIISDAVDYDITIVDDWISEVSRSGDRHTGQTVNFKAKANPNTEERNGVVSVCTKNGSCIPVMVKQGPGSKRYTRHHLAMRFTALWCGYCPYMDEVFHTVADANSDFEYMTIHASQGYALYFNGSGTLANTYHIQGFPTGILNGWQELPNYTNSIYAAGKVKEAMTDFDSKFICYAGIGINSSIADGLLTVNAEIESGLTENMKVSAFVLESGILEDQTYFPASGGSTTLTDFVHDNVVRANLCSSLSGDSFTTDGKSAEFTWTTKLDESWNSENLSVLVFVYRDYGDDSSNKLTASYPNNYIMNSRTAPVGESISIE